MIGSKLVLNILFEYYMVFIHESPQQSSISLSPKPTCQIPPYYRMFSITYYIGFTAFLYNFHESFPSTQCSFTFPNSKNIINNFLHPILFISLILKFSLSTVSYFYRIIKIPGFHFHFMLILNFFIVILFSLNIFINVWLTAWILFYARAK